MARRVSEEQKKRIWEQVRAEFPDDVAMQETHYVRMLHHYQTKDLTATARVRFYSASQRKTKTHTGH
jgi:hypothetical protein